LNKMCYSFNEAKNREEFLADEDFYCGPVGRGALGGAAREVLRNYHIPISNTAAAVQVLEAA